jgi:hypothetical protein
MIKIAIVLAALLAYGTNAQAREQPGPDEDFRSIVPDGWRLLPPAQGTNERRFVSPSGDAWLSLYADPARGQSVERHLQQVFQNADQVTYERRGMSWIVVSGYDGNRIFYRKAMLACHGRQWHHLAFEYPAAQKRAFDSFVTRASFALQAYQSVGCS